MPPSPTPAVFAQQGPFSAETQQVLDVVLAVLDDTKAQDVVAIDARARSGHVLDAVVICSASSSRHAAAIAERLRVALKRAGKRIRGIEGPGESGWTLIDALSVIAHVMSAEARRYYDLEELWDIVRQP